MFLLVNPSGVWLIYFLCKVHNQFCSAKKLYTNITQMTATSYIRTYICCYYIFLRMLTFLFASALIQFPSAGKDLLILAPSLMRAPLLHVTVALSDPARSIRDSFAVLTSVLRPAVRGFWWICTWNTACDREEVVLASVGCYVLFLLPCSSMPRSSLAL